MLAFRILVEERLLGSRPGSWHWLLVLLSLNSIFLMVLPTPTSSLCQTWPTEGSLVKS